MTVSRPRLLILLVVLLGAVAAGTWLMLRPRAAPTALVLYGNIDIRSVDLAFNDAGRIARVLVEEGAPVRKGQPLATLDAARFGDAVHQAQGVLAAAEQQLAKLRAGSRPQEIAQARAAVAAARATRHNAAISYERQRTLALAHLLPQQSADNALQTLQTARASLDNAQQALSLALQGPRREDIAAAQATVVADRAALALAQRQLADTTLLAPSDGVVQNRILEPGDMVSPQSPVLTLALTDPVWARAYLPEPVLGRVAAGMHATIRSDSFPGRSFAGWIGFISPTAEFTPKNVESADLRTELVYRVRVYACNPGAALRMGMPVTVSIPLHGNAPGPLAPCAQPRP